MTFADPASLRRCLRRVALLLAAVAVSLSSVADAGTFPADSRTEMRRVRNRAAASQFLQRTTFGPTWEEIDTLATRIGQIGRKQAFKEWIDAQFALPATLSQPLAEQMVADDGWDPTQDGVWIQRYRHHAWWHNAVTAPDQLRQRMAYALSQIFVIGDNAAGFNDRNTGPLGKARWYGPNNYYDMLLTNSFGNYRDTLYDVSVHPCMGVWLTHVRNRKANPSIGRYPDENYAREVMQLFSIGVNELRQNGTVKTQVVEGEVRPIETYDNDDIETFARVFTGLNYGGPNASNFWSPTEFEVPMVMNEGQHDTAAKTLLGGVQLPAGQSGLDDVNDALDNLFDHPNVGPFIARRLIQRFVKSNPSKWYIRRVANRFANNGQGVRGDWKAVLKAVLLDKEAITSQIRTTHVEILPSGKKNITGVTITGRGTEWSKLREPVLRYSAVLRQFDPVSNYSTGRIMFNSNTGELNQGPLKSPSVFNFYLPDHKPQGEIIGYETTNRIPDGELFAPEFQILTTVAANRMANRFNWDLSDGIASMWVVNTPTTGLITNELTLDYDDEIGGITQAMVQANGPELQAELWRLMDRLDLLLCHGTMSDEAKQTIVQALLDNRISWDIRRYVGFAILLTSTSPDCAITE